MIGEEVALFNPLKQIWQEHFGWSADWDRIMGMNATGRATVAALNLNRFHLVRSRRIWVKAGYTLLRIDCYSVEDFLSQLPIQSDELCSHYREGNEILCCLAGLSPSAVRLT